MKIELELREQTPEFQALLATALAAGLVMSFRMVEEKGALQPDDEAVREPLEPSGAPFKHGQRVVVVRRSTQYPDIYLDDAGTVHSLIKRGRGWAVEVDWDDGTYSTVSAGMLE